MFKSLSTPWSIILRFLFLKAAAVGGGPTQVPYASSQYSAPFTFNDLYLESFYSIDSKDLIRSQHAVLLPGTACGIHMTL